jgi:hypothetical protein
LCNAECNVAGWIAGSLAGIRVTVGVGLIANVAVVGSSPITRSYTTRKLDANCAYLPARESAAWTTGFSVVYGGTGCTMTDPTPPIACTRPRLRRSGPLFRFGAKSGTTVEPVSSNGTVTPPAPSPDPSPREVLTVTWQGTNMCRPPEQLFTGLNR